MKQTIQNIARRPIALHCNSGETLHLPPGYIHEISEGEVAGNALFEKLIRQKLLKVKSAKSEDSENKSSKKAATKSTQKSAAKA